MNDPHIPVHRLFEQNNLSEHSEIKFIVTAFGKETFILFWLIILLC